MWALLKAMISCTVRASLFVLAFVYQMLVFLTLHALLHSIRRIVVLRDLDVRFMNYLELNQFVRRLRAAYLHHYGEVFFLVALFRELCYFFDFQFLMHGFAWPFHCFCSLLLHVLWHVFNSNVVHHHLCALSTQNRCDKYVLDSKIVRFQDLSIALASHLKDYHPLKTSYPLYVLSRI